MRSNMIFLPLGLLSILGFGLIAVGRQSDRIKVGSQAFDRREVQLNTYTQSAQSAIALDLAPEGAVVAAWDSRRQDQGTYGVFARWVDPSGRPVGPEEQVNVERRSMQMKPAVSQGADGEACFAWQSFQQDGDAGAIVGRLKGDERILNENTAGDQSEVAIDRLADGRRVAVWKTSGEDPRETRIVVRLLTAEGETASEEFMIEAEDGSKDRLPTVAADRLGGFIVAWTRTEGTGCSDRVYALRFDAAMTPIGDPIPVSRPGASSIEPSIAVDRSGTFTVAWLEYNDQTEYDVMLRRFSADGRAQYEPSVASSDPEGWQSGAGVSMASNGRCLVAWTTSRDGGRDANVHARLFDPAGNPETDDFLVNGWTEGLQALSAASGARRVVLGDDGRMVFAWQGNSGHGDESAANLTMLIPVHPGLARDLAAGVRAGSGFLASLIRRGATHFERTATPYIPPTFDATARGPLLDPDHLVQDGREIGFTAFTSTGWTPPDPHMAAGPNHVMGIVNGGIVVYEKDGTLVWQDDISDAAGFWGPVGATNFVFDPEVIFDPYENRFIAMANERSSDNRSMFLIGISHTSDPSSQAAWYKYRLDVTALGGNDIDSPNLAVDRDAIYLTADFFTGGQKYLIYIIDKNSVINGGTPVTTNVLRTGSQSFGIPVMYTDDAPRMYMIEHFEADPSNTVRLWAINDPLGTPNLTSYTLSVPAYYYPANLRSQGTTVQVTAFDSRFWSCMYRNGSLWAAHHMSLSNSPRITASRWYEIEMNGWPLSGDNPTLRQSGTVAPPNQVYCSFNSITADASGNAVMVFARSSVNEYFSISRSFRFAGDPLGFMSPPEFVKQSTAAYATDRWGDYSATVADPVDPGVFWMHHEYTPGGNSWHTWIAGEPVSPPGSYLSVESTRVSDDQAGQSNGNGDGDLNPAETIELWVTLHNIGQQGATHVSGVLSLAGGQATILDGTSNWNDVPPGGGGESLTPFVFEISGLVSDGEVLPFLLTMTDDSGVRDLDLPLSVKAPDLSYRSHVMDDASHGNGNGIPEAGEVLVLPVTLLNSGGQNATEIEAALSSTSPNVVVIDDVGRSAGIDSGAQGLLDPPYRIAILSGAVDGEVLSFDLAITTASGYAATSGFSLRVGSFFFDDVETDRAWALSAAGDNAASGQWVRVDPIGTFQTGAIPVQPEDDHTPAPGTICFVTGQGSVGGAVGEADVDGGKTTLVTPSFDLTSVTEPILSYWCWYTNDLGNNPGQDVWLVQISSDGGVSWVDLENTTASHNTWEQRTFLLSNYVTPTNQTVVRFVASDEGGGSLVEAAVDDFSITGESGVVGALDLERSISLRLDPARPNPARDGMVLTVSLPRRGPVLLQIYHADGRLVRTLTDGVLTPGVHLVHWDGRSSGGQAVASGIYFARLSLGEETQTRRLVVLR